MLKRSPRLQKDPVFRKIPFSERSRFQKDPVFRIMFRSILSIVSGYGVMVLSIMALFVIWFRQPDIQPSHNFMVFSLAYGGVVAVVGGYVTATIANQSKLKHAIGLAVVVMAMGMVSAMMNRGQEPLWYQLSNIAIAVPLVISGGYIQQWPGWQSLWKR